MKVYYGLTSHSQLKQTRRDIPIMVSARWLLNLPAASVAFDYLAQYSSVFLDSGAFGVAAYDGDYQYSPSQYLDLVARIRPEYYASMDYCNEPSIRHGQTVTERIERTVALAMELASAKLLTLVPVIQGYSIDEYLQCVDLMAGAGLIRPVMGIGSLCRRGSQGTIVAIVREVAARLPSVKYHGFGIKINALRYNNGEILNYLDSIDTAAWQFNERDEQGGWRPRTVAELMRRLHGYSDKLTERIERGYQLILE